MSRFLRGETLVGQDRLKCTRNSGAQTCSALSTWSWAVQGWPELKAGLPVMKGSKMSCYFSGALALLKVLAGSCSVLGVTSASTSSLPYRHHPTGVTHGQDLVAVCGELGCHSKNQTPSQWEDPWRLSGVGCVGRAGGRCRWGFLSPTVGFVALALGLRARF